MAALYLVIFFSAIANADDVYLSIGPGGQRMFSTDGLAWSGGVSWGPPKHDQNDLHCGTAFRSVFYVGGGFSQSRLAATRDGKDWSMGELPRGGGPVVGLDVLNDNLFVTTMRGWVYRSEDGEQFTLVGKADSPKIDYRVRSTAIGNGMIIGAGDFGTLVVIRPKQPSISFRIMSGQDDKKSTLRRIAFGNGVFLVGGQNGLLSTSRDGVTWHNESAVPERGDIHSVVWTGKQFLAFTQTSILSSVDGLQWQSRANDQRLKFVYAAGDRLFGRDHRAEMIHVSSDEGNSWQLSSNPESFYLSKVIHGDMAGAGQPPQLPTINP